MAVTNAPISHLWTVIDLLGNRKTGLTSANFTIHLMRDSSASGETVAVNEVSAATRPGDYIFIFTPLLPGLYSLSVTEGAFANSQGLTWTAEFVVATAGSSFSPTYANAFCAETDIERVLGRALSSTSIPTSTEAAGFAEEIASSLRGKTKVAGAEQVPGSVTNPVLEDLLRLANATGAAWLCEQTALGGASPNQSDRALQFLMRYVELAGGVIPGSAQEIPGQIVTYIETAIAAGIWISSHLTRGIAQLPAHTSPGHKEAKTFDEATRW